MVYYVDSLHGTYLYDQSYPSKQFYELSFTTAIFPKQFQESVEFLFHMYIYILYRKRIILQIFYKC